MFLYAGCYWLEQDFRIFKGDTHLQFTTVPTPSSHLCPTARDQLPFITVLTLLLFFFFFNMYLPSDMVTHSCGPIFKRNDGVYRPKPPSPHIAQPRLLQRQPELSSSCISFQEIFYAHPSKYVCPHIFYTVSCTSVFHLVTYPICQHLKSFLILLTYSFP